MRWWSMNFHHTHPLCLRQSIFYGRQINHNFWVLYESTTLQQMLLYFSPFQRLINTTWWRFTSTCTCTSIEMEGYLRILHVQSLWQGHRCLWWIQWRTKYNTNQRRKTHITNKVNISKFVGKKDEFLSNDMNKQALIHLITDHLRQKGCHVIHAEGDADAILYSDISHYNVILQVNNPHWSRHGSVGLELLYTCISEQRTARTFTFSLTKTQRNQMCIISRFWNS